MRHHDFADRDGVVRHVGDAAMQAIDTILRVPVPDIKHAVPKDMVANQRLAASRFPDYLSSIGAVGPNAEKLIKAAEADLQRLYSQCESPIEKALAPWLMFEWYGPDFPDRPTRVHVAKEDGCFPQSGIVIVPQMAFLRYRLDFGVVAVLKDRKFIVAVECDGREHHTDIASDRYRDAYLLSWGIRTVRAKGAEIYTDPGRVSGIVSSAVMEAVDAGNGSALV